MQSIWSIASEGATSRPLSISSMRYVTALPWKSLSNLTTFDFRWVPSDEISVTRPPDPFEQAPVLPIVGLFRAFPNTSNAPRGRIVPLPHLCSLDITAQPAHSILLNHLDPNGRITDFRVRLQRYEIPNSGLPPQNLQKPRKPLPYHFN